MSLTEVSGKKHRGVKKFAAVAATCTAIVALSSCAEEDTSLDTYNSLIAVLRNSSACDIDIEKLNTQWEKLNNTEKEKLLEYYGTDSYSKVVDLIETDCRVQEAAASSSAAAESSASAASRSRESARSEALRSTQSVTPSPTNGRSHRTSYQTPSSRALTTQQQEPVEPAVVQPQTAVTPSPPVPASPGTTWRLFGPYQSTWTCQQDAELQPLMVSECFYLDDGAYFWNLVQAPQ